MEQHIKVTIPDDVIESIWVDISSGVILTPKYGAGYYLNAKRRLKDGSWIVLELDDDDEDQKQLPHDIELWWLANKNVDAPASQDFPKVPQWYLLNRDTAIQIAIAAFKKEGENLYKNWHEEQDVTTLDVLLQHVLFGEEKYG